MLESAIDGLRHDCTASHVMFDVTSTAPTRFLVNERDASRRDLMRRRKNPLQPFLRAESLHW